MLSTNNIKYVDKLYKSLASLKNDFLEIINIFGMNSKVKMAIERTFDRYQICIMNTDYSKNDLKKIYNECFAQMNEDTLGMIRENVFPYSMIHVDEEAQLQSAIDSGMDEQSLEDLKWFISQRVTLSNIIDSCHSINEILHAIHDYVMYNDKLLSKIPKIDEKLNSSGFSVSLRGNKNVIAEQVFENYDLQLPSRNVEIIGFDENDALIMCRDRGHAVAIEAERQTDGEIGIRYFLPKQGAFNNTAETVYQLKGVSINSDKNFAVGSFLTSEQMAAKEILNVVELAPTDMMINDLPAASSWTR